MFPGMNDFDISNFVADYFNKITENFTPLTAADCNEFDEDDCINLSEEVRLSTCKKPKSMVKCDMFLDLISKYAKIWAKPLTIIFNQCFKTGQWPNLWKKETLVVIPKNNAPEGLNDLRNLSCTPLFSKVMEFFVLERLKSEATVKKNQFRG